VSFEISPVHGTVSELESDLSAPPQHEREEAVVPVIKKAIAELVEALGGYLSVSANGNINPVSGETGDLVNIYITSLPIPSSAPVPVEKQEGLTAPEEPVPTNELSQSPPVQQEIPVITETPAEPGPSVPTVNAPEITPAVSPAEPIRIEPPAAPAPVDEKDHLEHASLNPHAGA
jgi:hypothetical protein